MTRFPDLYQGHAPIVLHQLFRDALDAYDDWSEGAQEPVVMFEGEVVPIGAVFDHMRDCTDILPNNLVGTIKERLTKPWTSDTPLEEMTVSTAARVMCVVTRKRLRLHAGGDLAAFIQRLSRHRGHRINLV